MSSRSAWASQKVSDQSKLHRETLSQKKKSEQQTEVEKQANKRTSLFYIQ